MEPVVVPLLVKVLVNLSNAFAPPDESITLEPELLKAKFGQVLGCPLFTLGSEICTQEKGLREKIQEVLDCHQRYITSAVREAHSAGLIDAPDAAAKARMLTAYFEGVLTQARILNSLEVLKEIPEGVLSILGAKHHGAVSA